jgi:hypothetical protein
MLVLVGALKRPACIAVVGRWIRAAAPDTVQAHRLVVHPVLQVAALHDEHRYAAELGVVDDGALLDAPSDRRGD